MSDRSVAVRSRARVTRSLAQRLGVRILSGALPPGYLFPGEIEYSEHLGLSRSGLREAFRILAAKGLVESRPKVGTRVNPRRRWSMLDPDLLAWQFEARPDARFLTDLFELRMMIEPAAAALAAERRSSAQVAAMADALDDMTRHGLATAEGRLADERFHTILLEATGNEAVMALSSSIMAAIAWTTLYKQRLRGSPRDPIPDHRALYRAVAAGTPVAARDAMAELVRLARLDTEAARMAHIASREDDDEDDLRDGIDAATGFCRAAG